MGERRLERSRAGYSALTENALGGIINSPSVGSRRFDKHLSRIYHCSANVPSNRAPYNKHPSLPDGEWDWGRYDAGDEMLYGISMKGNDFGKWPDKGDHELSRISLQPTDFQDQSPWLKLTGRSQGPWHDTNSPRLTRKERRARKRQTQIDPATETPGVEPPSWLPLTQAPGQVSRPI
jgi:hypothetical protein